VVQLREPPQVGRHVHFKGCSQRRSQRRAPSVGSSSFVEEPASDVVPQTCFFQPGGGQLQCLFVQLCRFVPAVLMLEGLGEFQQEFGPVGGIS
jgi:hypothetical protein